MYAILITQNGISGRFHLSNNGDPLVAINELQCRYLEGIIRCDYPHSAQLVDLGSGWRYSVTTVAEAQKGDPFYPPDDIRAYDQAA